MAETTYQVKLKNTSGVQVALFVGAGRGARGGGLQALTYRKRLRTPGGYTLRIFGDDERIDLFTLDCQLEFWRRDPLGGLDWYKDFEAFHRDWQFTQDSRGRDVFISRGRGYNDLCAAEPIRYPAASAQACKNAAAETCAKEFVDENIGPGAVPIARVMPGLTVQLDAATGAVWDRCRSGENLMDVLVELADYGPGDYMVVGTGPAAFEFRWRNTRWGDDRTRGNGVRPAVVFSTTLGGNATNTSSRYSRLDEVNVVYVLGTGVKEWRAVETVTTGAELDSPWARRAVSRDARRTDTAAGLIDKGHETLDKQRSRRTMTLDVRQTVATRYGRDWDFGDLITAEDRGTDYDLKIMGVTVGLRSDGEEMITPELINE